MAMIQKTLLFLVGGSGYCLLELGFRGWTHWSMFVLGGVCFLLIGHLQELERPMGFPGQLLAAWGICVFGELLFGLLVNRDWSVWDYRGQPLNWGGQICLGFSLLWIPLSAAAIGLYRFFSYRIFMHLSEFCAILEAKRKG